MPTEIYAGNVARITTTLTALDTPVGDPTAVVCVTTNTGTLVETLDETVTRDGAVVTVVADWTIPDNQPSGIYVATIDTAGTMVAADQVQIPVRARIHTDPHV